MKIFPKKYFRELCQSKSLEESLTILQAWIVLVLVPNSPFLRQVSTYHLREFGSSYAPRFFKKIVSQEILRLYESEDLKSLLTLAIIESYREFDPDRGLSRLNFMSWRIPYLFARQIKIRKTHLIEPFEEAYYPDDYKIIEETDWGKFHFDIIYKEAKVSRTQTPRLGKKETKQCLKCKI